MTSFRPTLLALALAIAGCASPIKTQKNAYSYLGRIVERAEDTVTEPLSRVTNDPTIVVPVGKGGVGPAIAGGVVASIAYESLPKTKKETYQRYKVALEQGETITVRSYETIAPNECVRVWIAGPGVSPVYWYAPNQAQLERASECASK